MFPWSSFPCFTQKVSLLTVDLDFLCLSGLSSIHRVFFFTNLNHLLFSLPEPSGTIAPLPQSHNSISHSKIDKILKKRSKTGSYAPVTHKMGNTDLG